MQLPGDHPKRFALSNEVHARPPEPLTAPVRLSCIALTTDWPYREEDREVVCDLTKRYGATPPGPGVKHYSVDLQEFRLIWERHTEFTRYTFITRQEDEDPFASPAIRAAPSSWVEALPGEVIAAANAVLVDADQGGPDQSEIATRYFSGQALIGSAISGGVATAFTDFRIHSDGFSRFLVLNKSMTPWQAGRIVQRLMEIETYRVVALLALPVAQALGPKLTAWESELAQVTSAMTSDQDVDEPALLERLTSLQAAIEKSYTESQFRFGAASAYYSLVQRRIDELREDRLEDAQTFHEFTERRLAPAMGTCQAVSNRQAALSERVDRAVQLLSTRVDMTLERQNQEVLESMNTRAELQLRLQQTVEGLSIAAITYYVVGVISYFAAGLESAGAPIDPKLIAGASVPLVLILVALGVWHTRRALASKKD
ncbi:MAG: DUF3422 domain-containing protein [Pseudomonadota bacterium]